MAASAPDEISNVAANFLASDPASSQPSSASSSNLEIKQARRFGLDDKFEAASAESVPKFGGNKAQVMPSSSMDLRKQGATYVRANGEAVPSAWGVENIAESNSSGRE
jgi:hypothetical protein